MTMAAPMLLVCFWHCDINCTACCCISPCCWCCLQQVQDTVVELMEGKVLVGHDLDHDLQALQLRCPWDMLRDTARWGRGAGG
jgi:hypothetical protein